MDVRQMRDYISNAYPGDKWKARCRVMRPGQVMAIYYSMMEGKEREAKARQVKPDKAGIQLTIFDLFKEAANDGGIT